MQLTALLGVPHAQLNSWLDSVSPSSPQLPQQWPSDDKQQEPQQGLSQRSTSEAQQLISLAAFAAAAAGQVSHVSPSITKLSNQLLDSTS